MDQGPGPVWGCGLGLLLVVATFWLPVGVAILAWRAWPWSGTAWVVIFVLLLGAWPAWELARHFRNRPPRGP